MKLKTRCYLNENKHLSINKIFSHIISNDDDDDNNNNNNNNLQIITCFGSKFNTQNCDAMKKFCVEILNQPYPVNLKSLFLFHITVILISSGII